MKAAIIGGGVIGGGWAARFLLNGWDVAIFDPDLSAERKIGEVLANARRSLPSLYDRMLPPEGSLSLHDDLADAVRHADWVQESVPERLDLKHQILDRITDTAPATATIASSTSGFRPSELTSGNARAIVAHPFNPVYLLPLVELVGDPATTEHAADILRSLGMYPLTIRREINAHIADRLLEAVWREALWLVHDDIATTEEIDEAIRMGFGLRWAQMGLFETYRIAGGEAGLTHFLEQFGPALKWPWTKLMDVPDFTPDLVAKIAGQSDAQSGDTSIRYLERQRDDNLVGILRSLKVTDSAAGQVIKSHEATLPAPATTDLPVSVARKIPQSWTDYNGHMNEAFYLEAGAQATDRFMELIGADATYIAAGNSYFTVENRITYAHELLAGEDLVITTQVLTAKGKKMHLWHWLRRGDGTLSATIETLLLHVDLTTRRSTPPLPEVADRLRQYAIEHALLAQPKATIAVS